MEHHPMPRTLSTLALGLLLFAPAALRADDIQPVDVEGQPLAANVQRLAQALDFLGTPLPAETVKAIADAGQDAARLQRLLDPQVLFVVSLNPEARVKVARGPGPAVLQQSGFTPVLIKVVNDSTVKKPLRILSPQAGPVYAGQGRNSADPKADPNAPKRFLQAELYVGPPMTAKLSGLRAEYCVALFYSTETGKREATVGFDVGEGNQDLGFRAEVPVLFDIKPAVPVRLSVQDMDGSPTVARFSFRDRQNRVYPLKAKRLAPDFFFQDQIYRPDGGTVLLPPGDLVMTYGRGPEYRQVTKKVTVPAQGEATIAVKLDRWVNPAESGFYSGDHHIHAAGCAHYTSPTEGVFAQDMFLHVKGEGLNVGCNLTWGPCFEFQRQFFEPTVNKLSEPFCVIKYDIEVSGFGSQALGHVCLLNLKDQTYPGSDGTKTRGWPTWTTPLMRWAKAQGAVTGYAHSANGLAVDPAAAAKRLLDELDTDKDGTISPDEAAKGLLPDTFGRIDADGDGKLTLKELTDSISRVRGQLPNYAVPEMNGIGAQEICVTTAAGLCDFISAMDTARVPEWNCWYHLMNCGFPLKASGETDFPCISGSRVGQGRVYVQLGKVDRVDFAAWCKGVAEGRSYISDGYAHALDFQVNGTPPGPGPVKLSQPGPVTVTVTAKVAFAREVPLGTSVGANTPLGLTRKVELVVNGRAVKTIEVSADDRPHDLTFTVLLERSSWVALRQFPQLHTNPVTVLVGDQPVRASRRSALWCAATIEQLWRVRGPGIAAAERAEAEQTFRKAIEQYRRIAADCPEGS
jgi:hypothetical protein